jgi:prepilin-type N-terminal cleavage/methylation domain-containing protein
MNAAPCPDPGPYPRPRPHVPLCEPTAQCPEPGPSLVPAGAARGGFSLTELLVVISIIAILLGLLLSALGTVRQQSRDLQCLSSIRQIGTAMLSFEVDQRRLPHHAAEAGDTNLAHAIASPSFDARLQYLPYMSVDHFLCPHLPHWKPSEATAANVHGNFVLSPGYFADRYDDQWSDRRWIRSSHPWTVAGQPLTALVMDRNYRWHTAQMSIINHAGAGAGFRVQDVNNAMNRGVAHVAVDERDLRRDHAFNVGFSDGSAQQYHGSDPELIEVPDRDPTKHGSYLMPPR